MDQTQEPIQSGSKIDNEENSENEGEKGEDYHCGRRDDYELSSELDDLDSNQVRFGENGERTSGTGEEDKENYVGFEDHERHSIIDKVLDTNGVDDEGDNDDKYTPNLSGDDETGEQEETPTEEQDEENMENEEEGPTRDNLDTKEESQRDAIADSEVSEEGGPEEEENENDIIKTLQKESQYDRASSFSSLSVNIGSTQQDSDSELQTTSRASPECDIGEKSFDRTTVDNDENEEEEVEADELEINKDESEEKDESIEEREDRLVKQAQHDIALTLDTQEKPEDDDDKTAVSEEPTSEYDTMAEAGLETGEDKDESEEESEKDVDEESEEAESEEAGKVPEVIMSLENKEEEEEDVCEKEEQKETKQESATTDDHSEHTKVKELGRIFQNKVPNAKAVYPREPNTSEKSPVSVSRFKEMFEHGEPLLSPAAYGTVPEEECASPRPGLVKNLRSLFENPKNFEWKETAKSTTVVN